ncbi:MAG: GreA/GreB family elongation factor [Bacteroidales bacterium]|nr:GreA/GreB family elongation factor [Bacteroidales bacterium]
MSRGFVKDGDIEEVPSVEQRAWIPEGVTNYVTPEGLALLNAERDELIARRDSASGNETDLRITRNYLNAKLQLLEERIASAVVPPIGSTPDKVGFGAYATVSINGGSSRTFRIVGADEADASRGLISFFSPVARAVAGHGAGERITSGLPSGNRELEVLAVSYDPLPLTVSESKQTPKSKLASPIIPASPAPSIGRAGFGFEEHLSCSSKANTRAQDGSANPPRRDDPFEILPLVNERGVTIGKATRKECHNGTKLLHPVVHLHLFNPAGEVYLQKRPDWKDIQPGKWDTAVGGHIGFGEPVEAALRREVAEEIGLEEFEPKLLGKYIFESSRDREFVYVYRAVSDCVPKPSAELDGGRFWPLSEISANMGRKVFTPNFESEFRKFFGKLL